MIVVQDCEFAEMNEEEGDGVETEADICQIQNLKVEASWTFILVELLGCFVDSSQIPVGNNLFLSVIFSMNLPDTKICYRTRSSDSELLEILASVADDTENVVVTETAKIEGDKVGEVADIVSDDVEIMFQKFITVSDIIVITGHSGVIQSRDIQMLQVLSFVQTVNDGLVGVWKRFVVAFLSWN